MDLAFNIETRAFNDALAMYRIVYYNKTAPDIINQAAKDVAFAAARKTKPAPYQKIKKHYPDKSTYPGRLLYAIQNPKANQPPSRPKLAPSMNLGSRKANAHALYNIRYSGRGYSKVGFLACAQLLGANVKTRVSQVLLRESRAKRASAQNHNAYFLNGAFGSVAVATQPLLAALDEVAAKKAERANARLRKLAVKYSG